MNLNTTTKLSFIIRIFNNNIFNVNYLKCKERLKYYKLTITHLITLSFLNSGLFLHSTIFSRKRGFIVVVVAGVDVGFDHIMLVQSAMPRIVLFTFFSSFLYFIDLPFILPTTNNVKINKKLKFFIILIAIYCFQKLNQTLMYSRKCFFTLSKVLSITYDENEIFLNKFL